MMIAIVLIFYVNSIENSLMLIILIDTRYYTSMDPNDDEENYDGGLLSKRNPIQNCSINLFSTV